MGYVGRRGQAIVETILDKYDVEKGLHPTRTARVITVMSSLAEKAPGLEVVGAGVDTMLRRKAQQPPQQPSRKNNIPRITFVHVSPTVH